MNNKKYKWLLFDFDNTLVDFTSASKQSLWWTFEEYQIECTNAIYKTYKKINHQVWTDFEHGKITAEALRPKRFSDLFQALNIENIDPIIFGQRYLTNLIEASTIYDGVLELLQSLKEAGYIMSIVTNGLKEVQRPRLTKLGMTDFFDSIIVSDEIGNKKPELAFFEYVYQTIPNPPLKSKILMIGDSINSDIRGGQGFGVTTCWNAHGQNNETDIIPDFVIQSVLELPNIL
jgi:YjjG family noncanonical pyrimidine nucleotidase